MVQDDFLHLLAHPTHSLSPMEQFVELQFGALTSSGTLLEMQSLKISQLKPVLLPCCFQFFTLVVPRVFGLVDHSAFSLYYRTE